MEKIKCYELDFGDTNLISKDKKDILDWIESEMDDIKEGGENLQYTISVKMLTQEEIKSLPDWA